MSARGPVGASNRADLFTARTDNKNNLNIENEGNNIGNENQQLRQEYGINENDDPLQLEHLLGYSAEYKNTVMMMPRNENMFLKRFFNSQIDLNVGR
jgi:hypothetical protein